MAIRPHSTQGRSIPGNVPQTFYPYIRPDSRQNANVRMMVKKASCTDRLLMGCPSGTRFRNAGVPLSREDAKMKAYEAVKKKYNEKMREVAEAQEVDRLRIEDEKQKKAEAKQREENKVEADRRLKAIISLQSHWRRIWR